MKKKMVKENKLSEILNPIANYLLSIENNIVSEYQSYYTYTLGVPKNWVIETDYIKCTYLKETNDLFLIKLEPILEISIDDFYIHVVNMVNKNILIDKKREELDMEINKLKEKYKLEEEELMKNLFYTDENGENNIN